jgi:conjugal transfer pilus assembly protein TraI
VDEFSAWTHPPADPGLPAITVDAVVQSQRRLIERLRQLVTHRAEPFDLFYLQPIVAVARYVHLLPASACEQYAGPGGLFRCCLEMAFHCRQAAEGRIFATTDSTESRHALEPRWRYAAFLSGLLCELYGPLSQAVVSDAQGRVWPKFMESLDTWVEQHGIERYFVCWHASSASGGSGAEGAAILGEIVPREQLAWLAAGAPEIVRDVFAIGLGQDAVHSPVLADLVHTVRELVLQAEAGTRRSRYGRLRVGHQLESHLLDALRSRVESGDWPLHNGAAGPWWFGEDGLYLAWPSAAEGVREHVVQLGLQGVPRSAFTLAEMLGKAGVLVPAADGQWLHKLLVSDPKLTDLPVYRTALRFKEAAAILGYTEACCLPRQFSAERVLLSLVRPTEAGLDPAPSAPQGPASLTLAQAAAAEPARTAPSSAVQSIIDLPKARAAAAPEPQAPVLLPSVPAPLVQPRRLGGKHALLQPQLLADWRELFQGGATHLLTGLPGERLAVSEDLLTRHALDLLAVVSQLEHKGLLGRGDWQGRATRIGLLPFADGPKLGFVLNASAAKAWGFFE